MKTYKVKSVVGDAPLSSLSRVCFYVSRQPLTMEKGSRKDLDQSHCHFYQYESSKFWVSCRQLRIFFLGLFKNIYFYHDKRTWERNGIENVVNQTQDWMQRTGCRTPELERIGLVRKYFNFIQTYMRAYLTDKREDVLRKGKKTGRH